MTGVDHAVAMGWADPERLICYGWSYGGYLSAWIVTQTDRFRAVSPGAALTNLYSMYSTNDIQTTWRRSSAGGRGRRPRSTAGIPR